ncbi:hypothetical protein C8R45DRAFT_1075204 [Mycena sanguinolenta]|nr:hypothetical protein C8R45DRAFT_1075204 [Mycena sanguinolenta]
MQHTPEQSLDTGRESWNTTKWDVICQYLSTSRAARHCEREGTQESMDGIEVRKKAALLTARRAPGPFSPQKTLFKAFSSAFERGSDVERDRFFSLSPALLKLTERNSNLLLVLRIGVDISSLPLSQSKPSAAKGPEFERRLYSASTAFASTARAFSSRTTGVFRFPNRLNVTKESAHKYPGRLKAQQAQQSRLVVGNKKRSYLMAIKSFFVPTAVSDERVVGSKSSLRFGVRTRFERVRKITVGEPRTGPGVQVQQFPEP